jgi:hypothetical protein
MASFPGTLINIMKNRFRRIQRGLRGGTFYGIDSQTSRRESLATKDSDEAAQLVLATNQSVRQPALSLQMAKAFLPANLHLRQIQNYVPDLNWLPRPRVRHPLDSRRSARDGLNAPRPFLPESKRFQPSAFAISALRKTGLHPRPART